MTTQEKMKKISQEYLKEKLTGIRIDLDNLAQEDINLKLNWPDLFNEIDKSRLKELQSLSKKIDRLVSRM